MDMSKVLDVLRSVPTGRVTIVEVDDDPSVFSWISSNSWIAGWVTLALMVAVTMAVVWYTVRLVRDRSHAHARRP